MVGLVYRRIPSSGGTNPFVGVPFRLAYGVRGTRDWKTCLDDLFRDCFYYMQWILVAGSTLPIELPLWALVRRTCSTAAEFFWPASTNPSCTVRI